MSEEYFEPNLPEEINQLCTAYSVLIEVDTGLLDKRDGAKLNKAKSKLLTIIVDYIEALPEIEKEED